MPSDLMRSTGDESDKIVSSLKHEYGMHNQSPLKGRIEGEEFKNIQVVHLLIATSGWLRSISFGLAILMRFSLWKPSNLRWLLYGTRKKHRHEKVVQLMEN
jgi:hypothetical protein